MAAQKKRQISIPQALFQIPLLDAVADLILPTERQEGDTWHFQVRDDVLEITRVRPVVVEFEDPGPGGSGPSPEETDSPSPLASPMAARRVR